MWSHAVVLFYPHARSTASSPAKTGLPTLMAATREPDIAQKQLSGVDVAGKTFKVHLDGYDQRDLLAGGPNGAACHAARPVLRQRKRPPPADCDHVCPSLSASVVSGGKTLTFSGDAAPDTV